MPMKRMMTSRVKRRHADEEDDDQPRKRRHVDEEDDDRPRKRRPDGDGGDDDDDRPRKRRDADDEVDTPSRAGVTMASFLRRYRPPVTMKRSLWHRRP